MVAVFFAWALYCGCSSSGTGTGVPANPLGTQGPGNKPVVKILSPSPCARIQGNIIVEISATDDVGVTVVYVLLDNVVKAIMTGYPYYVQIPVGDLPADGTYMIQALAFDAAGNFGSDGTEIRLNNNPPFIKNLLVVDADADPLGLGGPYGAVFRVNTDSGKVCALASSTLFSNPVGIAIDPNGEILVSDRTADLNGPLAGTGAIFRVDPDKYNQVEPFLTGVGFRTPAGIDEPAGTIYLVDSDANPDGLGVPAPGAIFAINPVTGAVSTLVSDAKFVTPVSEFLMSSTEMWIVDSDSDSTYNLLKGAIFRYDPVGGSLVLAAVSNLFINPFKLVSDGAGGFILTDPGDFLNYGPGKLFRIDTTSPPSPLYPVTLYRSGDPLASPSGIILNAAGSYLIADRDADINMRGAIIELNPVTSEMKLLYRSDMFVNPYDLVESWK